jgi:hypothetical protein
MFFSTYRRGIHMVRSSFAAACLALCGVMFTLDASAQDPRSCDTEFPHLQCGIGNFKTVTLLGSGGDPCESLLCLPITHPLEPVLKCKLEDAGIICEAWPRNPPSYVPKIPENPILYRWEVHGDISGGDVWTENSAAMFGCTAGAASTGIIELEIMSPYGLTSGTSIPVSCAPPLDLGPGELDRPTLPQPPIRPADPQS